MDMTSKRKRGAKEKSRVLPLQMDRCYLLRWERRGRRNFGEKDQMLSFRHVKCEAPFKVFKCRYQIVGCLSLEFKNTCSKEINLGVVHI